jgi:hypothetical protein
VGSPSRKTEESHHGIHGTHGKKTEEEQESKEAGRTGWSKIRSAAMPCSFTLAFLSLFFFLGSSSSSVFFPCVPCIPW